MNWVNSILTNSEDIMGPESAIRRKQLAELRDKFPWLGIEYRDVEEATRALEKDGFSQVRGLPHVFTRHGTTAYVHRKADATYLGDHKWQRHILDKATIHCYQHSHFEEAVGTMSPKDYMAPTKLTKSDKVRFSKKLKQKQQELEEV